MFAVLVVLHLYVWQRLVRDTMVDRRRRRVAGFVLLGAAGLLMVELLAGPRLPRPYESWLAAPAWVWLGLLFYLVVVLAVLEVPVLLARLAQRWAHRRRTQQVRVPAGDPPDPGRRLVLRRAAAVTASVVAAGVAGYGVTRAYREPSVTRLDVPLPRLDRRADGLRVAVIADIHVGPLYGAGQAERMVRLVNRLDADIITVVGDMVSSEVGKVRQSAAPLRDLRSRYGAYFVTGNHEYYTGHEEWIEAAGDLGLRVLRNERVEIAHRGGVIDLAGVNDHSGTDYDDPPDYQAALGDRDPSRPVLLLAHQPVQVRDAAAYGVDLQLSGHTHGGQLFPFHYLVRLEQPAVSGLAEVDGTRLYVTRGAGFWGPPMRVGADPEVTLLTLRST